MDTVLTEYTPSSTFQPLSDVPGFVGTALNILTAEECQQIIQIAEEKGFVPASIFTDYAGQEHFSDTRKSHRCIIDSEEFVKRLWLRLKPFVPEVWKRGEVCVGLNERLRILRYDPGEEFRPHRDGSYMAPSGAISKLTLLIYLNEGYESGYTAFLNSSETAWVAVTPYTGSVAIQDQELVHFVPPLKAGRKYAIRTDIMYMPQYTKGDVKEIWVSE
jgi:hypothetical protein